MLMGENSLFLEAAAVEKLLQRGEGRVPAGSRGRRLAHPNPSPRVTGPDGVSASGVREETEREVDMPKSSRTSMLRGAANEDDPLPISQGGTQREEKLAEPKVRNDKEGFAGYHAPEIRVMEGDGGENGPKLLSGRLDASRDIPVARKVDVRDDALADTKVASATEGVTKSSIASPEDSEGRPMSSNNRTEIMSKPSKGPKGCEESLIGGIKPRVVGDEVAVKRVNALSGNQSKKSGKNAFVGPGPPGRDGNRPSDAIMGGGRIARVQEGEDGPRDWRD